MAKAKIKARAKVLEHGTAGKEEAGMAKVEEDGMPTVEEDGMAWAEVDGVAKEEDRMARAVVDGYIAHIEPESRPLLNQLEDCKTSWRKGPRTGESWGDSGGTYN